MAPVNDRLDVEVALIMAEFRRALERFNLAVTQALDRLDRLRQESPPADCGEAMLDGYFRDQS